MKTQNKDFFCGLALAFCLCFLLLIYAPFELYLTNQTEFWFTAGQMVPYSLGLFAAALLTAFIVLAVSRRISKKLFYFICSACFVVLVCSWIQGSFLVFHLPAMNGEPVYWGEFPLDRACSAILWLVVIAAAIVLIKKLGAPKFVKFASLAGIAVAFILAVTLGTLLLTTDRADKSRRLTVTDNELFTYSEDENFLILVLDAVDATAFEQSMARDANYPEVFEDFTYFSNTVGGYPYSHCSIPLIITGQWYEAQEDFASYERAAVKQSLLLNRLTQSGYTQGLYLPDLGMMATVEENRFENLTVDKPTPGSVTHMCKLLIKMAIIKHAPWDLKQFGYDLPGRLNEHVKLGGEYEYYDWSDLSLYKQIKDSNPIETDGEKRFKYIHLEGAHEPHRYDKDLNVLDSSPYRDVIEANFTMLDAFFGRMKEAGVYDNAVIIVMSDHGSHNETDLLTINQNPILLIKGRGEHHEMQINAAPISFDDLQQAYLKLLDGAQSDGVFDWHEGDQRERRFMWHELTDIGHITEYVQTDDAADMDTLRPTGKIFGSK